MNNKFVFKVVFAAILVICFASCDKDFDQIGSGIVGEDHFLFEKYTDATVIAYNHLTKPVQTNNLPVNQLGYVENPVFGNTTANFVGQLELPSASLSPTFGANIAIDSVYFTLPYFSHKDPNTATTSEGVVTYLLDSIKTVDGAKFNLSIYENGYYLNDFDPTTGFEQVQRFFNNQNSDFDMIKKGAATDGSSVVNGERLNNASAELNHWPQNDGFVIDKDEVVTNLTDDEGVVTRTRTTPGMRIKMNSAYFMKKIFNAPADKLANNAAFKDYFRGLYFKITNPEKTNLMQLNFAKGIITIYYKEDKTTVVDGVSTTTRVDKTYAINLQGNTVNLLSNSGNAPYLAAIPSEPNVTTGDSRLYLKGGEGAMAFIDLFGAQDTDGNGVSDELETLRASNWLINEANLTFYMDNTPDSPSSQIPKPLRPLRIYLYDADNNTVLYDYSTDVTTNTNAKFSRYTYGGIIDTVSDTNGRIKYKIRITNHIRNVIRKSADNVRLGLVVTEAIAETGNAALQTPFDLVSPVGFDELFRVKSIPVASVMNPLGVVLFGNNIPPSDTQNYANRLQLEIYYTKF
ncbi:MAG: DUF4270 domain-containing protein [Flavobacterium sp.]|nr:DUF4270 domain-containing protein [Flavobacterium sp.]